MRKITSQDLEARVRWKNWALKTQVLIVEMDKVLPHGTRVLKTWVPKKNTNEDGNEDEEPEMGRRSKTGEPEMGRRCKTGDEEAEVPISPWFKFTITFPNPRPKWHWILLPSIDFSWINFNFKWVSMTLMGYKSKAQKNSHPLIAPIKRHLYVHFFFFENSIHIWVVGWISLETLRRNKGATRLESKWWNSSLKNSSSTWIFFPHQLPPFTTRVLKTWFLSWNSSFKYSRC